MTRTRMLLRKRLLHNVSHALRDGTTACGGLRVRFFSNFVLSLFLTSAAFASPASAAPRPGMPDAWTTMRLVPSLNAVVGLNRSPHWTFASDGAYSSSPVVVDNVVYLADNAGNINALDVATGHPRWHAKLANAVMSAPISARGLVYVGEGNEDATTYAVRRHVQVGLVRNALVALDAQTGRVRWRYGLRGTGMPTGALLDGMLVHHDGSGDVVALDAMTGALRWRRNIQSASSMSAAVPLPDGTIASAGLFPNIVIAVGAADGATRWTKHFSAAHSGIGDCPLAFDGTNLYGTYLAAIDKPVDPGVRARHHIYALRASDGALVWDRALESGDTPVRNEAAIPIVVDGVVYDGSAIGAYMHALDAKTGRVLWTHATKGEVKGAPVLVGGTLYFGDLHGYLWALDAKSGELRGALRTSVRFNVGSAVAVGQSLLIGSIEGVVVMLPLSEIAGAKDV